MAGRVPVDLHIESMRVGARVLDWSRTYVMGIINVTPDSFSDGGLFFSDSMEISAPMAGTQIGSKRESTLPDFEKAIRCGMAMVEAGVDILDIGGESTRPGSDPVSVEEEKRRVIPVIRGLVDAMSALKSAVPISIDTYKSQIARAALEAGASMINDVSGLTMDPELADVAAAAHVPIVLGHIRGTPKTMQKKVFYKDLQAEVEGELKCSIEKGVKAGVDPNTIIVDPGIGFGKTPENNLELILQSGGLRSAISRPVLVGASRKSFIGHFTEASVRQRLSGSLTACVVAVLNGADIVRVHDVGETIQAVRLTDAFKKSASFRVPPVQNGAV